MPGRTLKPCASGVWTPSARGLNLQGEDLSPDDGLVLLRWIAACQMLSTDLSAAVRRV